MGTKNNEDLILAATEGQTPTKFHEQTKVTLQTLQENKHQRLKWKPASLREVSAKTLRRHSAHYSQLQGNDLQRTRTDNCPL